jgi:hypothetical protein
MSTIASEISSLEAKNSGVMYHGEALARIPFLERVGGWIVLGFTVVFAGFLLLMKLEGQIPGQSFSLKSISDCLQFGGECVGLAFSAAVALRLRKESVLSMQRLWRLGTMSGPTDSEMVIARNEAQNVRRSYRAWALLSIAIAVYACGQAIWTGYDVRMPSANVPFPGLYDIGFVAAYPFFVVGALLLTRRRSRGVAIGRLRVFLDALLVIGAAFSLSWFFILSPSVAGLAQQPGFGAAFLAIYFPGGDLLLVALGALLMLSQFSTREQQAVFARLCLGLFFLAVTDSLLVWLSLSFSFNTGTIQDILWPLSMQMVGLAALAYPRSVAQEQERAANTGNAQRGSLNAGRFSMLGLHFQTAAPFVLALGTSAVLLTIVPETAPSQRFVASLIALILFVLVAIRQALTLNENNRLRLQLAGELVLSRRELQVTRQEADRAMHDAQEKQQLEQGVVALQAVHARIAQGDFSVRALTDPGPLQTVAVSFNLMIERLKGLVLQANRYEQLVSEVSMLQEALEHLSRGVAAWPLATNVPGRTELLALYLGIERVQRFQESQWRSLLVALERTVAPLERMHTVVNTAERQEEYLDNPLSDRREKGAVRISAYTIQDYTIQQVEQQLQKLIEQIRSGIERLEGKPMQREFPLSPQPNSSQPSFHQDTQERERKRVTSQPLQPGNDLLMEGPQQNKPNHLSYKIPRSSKQARGGDNRS